MRKFNWSVFLREIFILSLLAELMLHFYFMRNGGIYATGMDYERTYSSSSLDHIFADIFSTYIVMPLFFLFFIKRFFYVFNICRNKFNPKALKQWPMVVNFFGSLLLLIIASLI